MNVLSSDYNQYKISIIMSVFNDDKYLSESIASILNQTYPYFEFIILNDGSTDNSTNIIKKYKKIDKRIIFIDGAKEGLTKKLNYGIKKSKGIFIARHDSDDISHKDRLMHQVNFFKSNKDYALCGTFAEVINEKSLSIKKIKSVYLNNQIKHKLKFSNIIIHSSIMINKKIVTDLYYDERYRVSQDYELWSRIAKKYKCYIIPKYLIKNRRHSSNTSNKSSLLQEKNSVIISFLYNYNLQLPSFPITDTSKSFDEIISFFSNKDAIYREDLKIRKYVYLYKIVPSLSIMKIQFKYFYKIIIFYIHKPSMFFKRVINLIR